ncbi:hypothetical protein ACJX0J_022565, partial [Zea mays]
MGVFQKKKKRDRDEYYMIAAGNSLSLNQGIQEEHRALIIASHVDRTFYSLDFPNPPFLKGRTGDDLLHGRGLWFNSALAIGRVALWRAHSIYDFAFMDKKVYCTILKDKHTRAHIA